MSLIRKALYPISVLYGQVVSLRNVLYDKGVFKSTRFETPTIVVGNLSVGGTGKSPQIEYLIRLLKDKFKIATLSRGYKRKSKGFIVADSSSNAEQIGDEPYQFYRKFNDITVCVDADRVNAINQLKKRKEAPEIILLDDAFQHRKVDAGFNILLTSYDSLYVDDVILPTGNLRENKKGAERAQVIVVTKCPPTLSEKEQFEITKKINPSLYQTVFFTTIGYQNQLKSATTTLALEKLKDYEVLLITGIAKPKPLVDFLKDKVKNLTHLKYSDHHNFSSKEVSEIQAKFDKLPKQKILLTTEKDFVRLSKQLDELFYIEIETKFLANQEDFDRLILNYVLKAFKMSE